MLINTFLDTEDFVHLYYTEDEPAAAQGCAAGARMASKYPPRPPSPEYSQVATPSSSEMSDRERFRAPPQPEPPPHRVRAADLYPRLRTHYDEPGLDVPFTPICGEFVQVRHQLHLQRAVIPYLENGTWVLQPESSQNRVQAASLYPQFRTYYDEPELDLPFTPICGEFVQWVGRMADSGIIAMSNYRLHAQPRRRNGPGVSIPIRLIDALEIRDLLHLIVLCKNGRQLKCSFTTGEQCVEWWRRLNTAMAPMSSMQETFAAAYAAWAKEQPPSSVHRALLKASNSAHRHWFGPELERMGFTTKGAWRVTAANAEFKLCPSYPPLLVVPASICDEDLDSVARFRAMRRIPAVVWRHRGNGAVIARSSQPEVGWLGWRSSEDERLLAALGSACGADPGLAPPTNKQIKLLIVDARSYASAVTNRARGGGCECAQYYPNADIQFMSMPNIHHVRRSFQQLRALAADCSDQTNWHSNLERTLWLQYVSGIARAAGVVCRAVLGGRPVLVHCSDGWDRTPQIVAAAQLLLDPHYRTLEGFRILIEREWLDFGHKFADRCGHQFGPEEPNERSPIFLQWLDWVHQMALQYPCSFEFNEAYLIKLGTHVHSCMFGTFLCNTVRERSDAAHVWPLLRAPAYRNHLYLPHQQDQVLWPDYSVRSIQVWTSMFGGERGETVDEIDEPKLQQDLPRTQHTNGLMTKTRSCDNLLNEGEKRTTQRRCSDPSIAPDVMKLSMVVNECDSRRECRSTLTDSCVDELPLLQRPIDPTRDQVDGLHPDHFENSRPRDLTSGSSSLERELCPPNITADVTEITDVTDVTNVTDAADRVTPVIDVTVGRTVSIDVETPEEQPVFVCDPYTDVISIAEVPRESGRTRNISITWRSISESSNQSSTFDVADSQRDALLHSRGNSHEASPQDNHNSTEGDLLNHNVERHRNGVNGLNGVNGMLNGIEEVTTKFLDVELNGAGTSSSLSSESEGEAGAAPRRAGHARARGSQLTLCPASPRRACCHCSRRPSTTSGIETSGDSGGSAGCWCGCAAAGARVRCVCGAADARVRCVCGAADARVRCVCGAADARVRCVCGAADARVRCVCGAADARVRCVCGAAGGARADAVDGLPPAADPLQARLHQIILYQRKVVEELSGQLREAREALRLSSPTSPLMSPHTNTSAPPHKKKTSVGSVGSVGSGSGSVSSSSGSASEVEVGEEARGVVWLPDSAAPRCQHCHHHFWLARRRHHCRRCGGIFCSSCSEMSPWGECGAVRVCRRCRALR